MKLSLIDFIAIGVTALGAVLTSVCGLQHASEAAIRQVNVAFEAAEQKDEEDEDT